MFSTLCYVEADISHVKLAPRRSLHTSMVYYRVDFDVIFSFGLTELKACISWMEDVSLVFAHRTVLLQ